MQINSIEKIALGGADQWITIRGGEGLPLLLFLHGGPGCPQTGAQHKYNRVLEEHYLVVNWDQRGAGKSYNPAIPPETMTVSQLVRDAEELCRYLLKRFGQEKLYVMGHSIGALLGMMLARNHPELLRAYVGINQPLNRTLEEEMSYAFCLDKADALSNKKATKDLRRIGPPKSGSYSKPDHLVVQRTWLTKFGGVTYKKNAQLINLSYIFSSHLTWRERMNFMRGFSFTAGLLWDELCQVDLTNPPLSISVPVFLVMGRHDKIVHDLAEKHFQEMKAPKKELYIFEESGHMACFEEPDRFNDIMINTVLK